MLQLKKKVNITLKRIESKEKVLILIFAYPVLVKNGKEIKLILYYIEELNSDQRKLILIKSK